MHIPRAICSEDQIEMTPSRNGVLVEMIADFGSYYKIFADEITCSRCGKTIMLPSGQAVAEHYQDTYDQFTADRTAVFK
jgi:hypothetical protein